MTKRWAVFISGRGSNLQALLDTLEENRICLVVTSSARTPGTVKAKRSGIPVLVLDRKINWLNLDHELRRRAIDYLMLAGFMRLVPASFLASWEARVLNLHPSLLPAYPGLDAIGQSYRANAAMGVTLHVVTPEMDAGPRLLQKCVLSEEKRLADESKFLTLGEAEFLISLTEQRLIRESLHKFPLQQQYRSKFPNPSGASTGTATAKGAII